MLKIGEFSKLSHLTVKALRFYEKEGLLAPASIDEWTGYRFYETGQLEEAAKIKAYRQLDLSIEEIKTVLGGADAKSVLTEEAKTLRAQKAEIDVRLSIINHILEDEEMKYQVTVKEIPSAIVYYSEVRLPRYSDMMQYIPEIGAECMRLNPGLKCAEPPYEFCEYLDEEHKDTDVRIRHNEAVAEFGVESENIKFRQIPPAKVLSIFHKGSYSQIGEAYAFLMKYAEENGYKAAGLSRECYIDGIWNKESAEDWLTEIQLPIDHRGGKCEKKSFAVIGKEGSTLDGVGFIQRLWDDANSHFGEIQQLAKKDENGDISGIWGAMSDLSRSFNPWENFSKGLYLAGIECETDAEAPKGWTKWTIPGYEYIYAACENENTFSDVIQYLKENKISLAGAAHDFICPRTGQNYIFFPIRKL